MACLTDEVEQCGRDMDDLGLQTVPPTSIADTDPATSVAYDSQLGRVLVAKRPFDVGDVVLREPPLLTFASIDRGPLGMTTDGGPDGLLQMFQAASETCKAAILDMFHPPLEGSTHHIKNRREEAKIHAKQLGMDFALTLKLLLIRDTNAHSFSGQTEEYAEIQNVDQSRKLSLAALFDLGSKAAHSCDPNIEYSSKQFYGLEYRAIRPILEGEYLCFSYIGDLWTSSQVERQNALLMSKFFLCKCIRCCDGKDDSRAVTCTKCKTRPAFPRSSLMSAPTIGSTVTVRGLQVRSELNGQRGTIKEVLDEGQYVVKLKEERVAVKVENVYSPEKWKCACGHSTERSDVHGIEAAIAQDLEKAQDLAHRALHLVTPKYLDDMVSRAIQLLSPTHFLVARALTEANTILASHAIQLQEGGHMTARVALFRQMAAQKGIAAVKTMECMKAGCGLGAGVCTLEHPCVHEAAQLVFFSGQDLLAMPPKHRDMGASIDAWPALVLHVSKYHKCLQILYGDEDEDVIKIMSLVQQSSDVNARYCENTGCSRRLDAPLLRCARCKTAAYCSKDCQSKAWKAGHKRECQQA